MSDIFEQRERYRLMMLKALYEETNAGAWKSIQSVEFRNKLLDLGIPKIEVEAAHTWLERERLVESPIIGGIGITHDGIRAYEATKSKPVQGTREFPASTINNVFNIHAPVSGIQTGSYNMMNAAQQINGVSGQDLATLFAQLRDGIAKLPNEQREEVEVVAGELEKQATSDKPSKALVKSYASTLNNYLTAYAPVIVMIVDWCAKKWGK